MGDAIMRSREHPVGCWSQLVDLGCDDPLLGNETAGQVTISIAGKSLKRAPIITTLLADARAGIMDMRRKGIECYRPRDAPCCAVEGYAGSVDNVAVAGNERNRRLVQLHM